jgi:hypothetical protein
MSEENFQQISPDEIERRIREAEELFYKYFFYFATKTGFYIFDNGPNIIINDEDRFNLITRYLNLPIQYLTSSNNYPQEKDFFDFVKSATNEQGIPIFVLPELPEPQIPIRETFIEITVGNENKPIEDFLIEKIETQNSFFKKSELEKTNYYKQKVLKLFDRYKSIYREFNNSYLYTEILKWHPNASVEQIITAAELFKHSLWYNKWGVLSYYSKNDLDVISYAIDSFPDNARRLCKFFYSNRRILSQNPHILAVAKELCNNNYDDFMLFCKMFMKYPELLEIGRNENSNEHINRSQLMTFINILSHHRFNFHFVSKKDIIRNISLPVLDIINNELNLYYEEDKHIILDRINSIAYSHSGNLSSFIQSYDDLKNIVRELGTVIRTEREINCYLCELQESQGENYLSVYIKTLWQFAKSNAVKLYIFNQVSEKLPENSTAKRILEKIVSQDQENETNEFRKSLNDARITSSQQQQQSNAPNEPDRTEI